MDTKAKVEKRREESRKAIARGRKRAASKISPKVKRGLVTALVIVGLIVFVGALIFPNTGISRRITTALTVGDVKVSTAEYSYYYRSSFNNYYNTMLQYFGADSMPISTTTSLEKQAYSEDQTYADYFSTMAVSQIKQLIVLEQEGKKAGFSMPADVQQNYEETIASVETAAGTNGLSVNDYITQAFGMGFTRELLEKVVYRELYANAYQTFKQEESTYSEEDLTAYYEEHRNDFLYTDFVMQQFDAAVSEEVSAEDAAAAAKAEAEALLQSITGPDSFSESATKASNTSYYNVSSTDQNLCDWLFSEERQAGDKSVIESVNGNRFFTVYVEQAPYRVESETVNVRHILFMTSGEDEEANAEAKAKAEEVYEEWLSGGADEDLFSTLATTHTEDTGSAETGGLYEDVYPGMMVEEFNDWCFDEARFPGDSAIVETSYGYHIMYFVGKTGNIKWMTDAEDALRAADYQTWYEGAEATYEVKEFAVGKWLRNEPF